MTRVYFCEEWTGNYWKTIFVTDSALVADRWRRNGVKGRNRKFMDHICYNETECGSFMQVPEGVNQEQ